MKSSFLSYFSSGFFWSLAAAAAALSARNLSNSELLRTSPVPVPPADESYTQR